MLLQANASRLTRTKPNDGGNRHMKVSTPTVGPIVGHTTHDQARIFLRGELQWEGSTIRRCFGVVRWKAKNAKNWSAPLFNKLSPNFDMTAVLVLEDLAPKTRYEYQCGWFIADAELEKIQELSADSSNGQLEHTALRPV